MADAPTPLFPTSAMLRLPASVLHALLLFAGLIGLGAVLFVLDWYTLARPGLVAGLLLLVTAGKLWYCGRAVLGWIRRTVDSTEHLHHLTTFMALTVLLIITSYALDYYCLHRIYPGAFRLPFGERDPLGQLLTFFYLSAGTFTTAGSNEVYPTTLLGQCYVTSEMLIGYATTVLVVANLAHLRHLFRAAYRRGRQQRAAVGPAGQFF
ncbi:hypothetical protein GCM10028821_03270 [Hymenobacter jeollabukensis]